MSDVLSELAVEPLSNPDAQATITDYLDYTEYLPSDLIRSLTLVKGLDDTYLKSTKSVHELTQTYGQLPSLPTASRPDGLALRKQISYHLDRAITSRESSYAEACRLYDVIDRHYNRLGNIITKLKEIPKPTSRDPTPAPVSSAYKRSRSGCKLEEPKPIPRITLRLDAAAARQSSTANLKSRNRRVTVPGEVLPPFNPDSPLASTVQSDWESEPASPIPLATSRVGKISKKDKEKTKVLKLKKIKPPKPPRAPKLPGMGTNVHSAVAGISTSNALALCKPPPENAKIGSEHLPWMRLTEWEMAKLRKKMKKNAVWDPSPTMIRRSLAERDRGWENYKLARARTDQTGEEFIDDDKIAETHYPGKPLRKGEIGPDTSGTEERHLSNRGMKLNEAKKLKRETIAREAQAAAAAEAEMAAKKLGDIGSAFKNLFNLSQRHVSMGSPSKANGTGLKDKGKAKPPRKRKREDTVTAPQVSSQDANLPDTATTPTATAKKRKITKPAPVVTSTTTTTIPLAAPGLPKSKSISISNSKTSTPLSSPMSPKRSTTTASATTGRRSSVIAKTAPTATPPASRPPSRRLSRSTATSVEPGQAISYTREHLRRKSSTPAVKTPVAEPVLKTPVTTTAAGRRSKRPAPGPVTSSQDGGASVSVGRRKAKPGPKKGASPKDPKGAAAAAKAEELRIDIDGVLEEIDPKEPRYCVCGDVSFGTMILCEGSDCEREWFHLECVGLTEVPGRTAKWYCPDCRKKLAKGLAGPDGIVRAGGRR